MNGFIISLVFSALLCCNRGVSGLLWKVQPLTFCLSSFIMRFTLFLNLKPNYAKPSVWVGALDDPSTPKLRKIAVWVVTHDDPPQHPNYAKPR